MFLITTLKCIQYGKYVDKIYDGNFRIIRKRITYYRLILLYKEQYAIKNNTFKRFTYVLRQLYNKHNIFIYLEQQQAHYMKQKHYILIFYLYRNFYRYISQFFHM